MSGPAGGFSGDLSLIGLFDLGQLLMLNRSTGCLSVTSEGRRGFLHFVDGRIVNAIDDGRREGESAAYVLFSWRTGRFEFRAEPPSADSLIEVTTEALMLEAARRLDEWRAEGAEPATRRLQERAEAFEALRDAFHSVARDARAGVPATDGGAGTKALDALRRPGDRLVLRPGRPARVRTGGRWREARDAALTAPEYEELRGRLLGEPGVTHVPGGVRVSRLGDDRAFEVVPVGTGADESLWLRPALLPAPDPEHLEGPLAALQETSDAPRSLVQVCGSDPDEASRLLHAIAAWHVRRGATVLVVADHPTWRHAEGHGVMAMVAPPECKAAMVALEPLTLVLDLGGALPEGALADLDPVRHVVARTAVIEPGASPSRSLARLGGAAVQRLTAHVEGAARADLGAVESADPERVVFERLERPRPARERALLDSAASLAAAFELEPPRDRAA